MEITCKRCGYSWCNPRIEPGHENELCANCEEMVEHVNADPADLSDPRD